MIPMMTNLARNRQTHDTVETPGRPSGTRTYEIGRDPDMHHPVYLEVAIGRDLLNPEPPRRVMRIYCDDCQNRDLFQSVQDFTPGWSAQLRDEVLAIWNAGYGNIHAGCQHQRLLGWGYGRDVALAPLDMTPIQLKTLTRLATARTEKRREAELERRLDEAVRSQRVRRALWTATAPGETFTTAVEDALKIVASKGGGGIDGWKIRQQVHDALRLQIEQQFPVFSIEPQIFKDSIGAPCPECGYGYGSAWVFDELPDAIATFMLGLPNAIGSPERPAPSPYDLQAERFLDRFGLAMQLVHSQVRTNDWAKASQHWRVTILSNGHAEPRRTLSFDFWNSANDTEAGIRLRPYTVLSSLSSDISYDDAEETIKEIGGTIRQTRKAAVFAKKLQRFFTEEERRELETIQ